MKTADPLRAKEVKKSCKLLKIFRCPDFVAIHCDFVWNKLFNTSTDFWARKIFPEFTVHEFATVGHARNQQSVRQRPFAFVNIFSCDTTGGNLVSCTHSFIENYHLVKIADQCEQAKRLRDHVKCWNVSDIRISWQDTMTLYEINFTTSARQLMADSYEKHNFGRKALIGFSWNCI